MVTADEESFTAVRHHMIRFLSMTTSQVTAISPRHWTRSPQRPMPPPALPCTSSTSPGGSGTPGARRRHARNSRTLPPPRPPSPGNPRSPNSHPASTSPGQDREAARKEKCPASRGRGPWNRAPFPPRHAGPGHVLTPSGNRLPCIHGTQAPQHPRKPETPKVRGVAPAAGRRGATERTSRRPASALPCASWTARRRPEQVEGADRHGRGRSFCSRWPAGSSGGRRCTAAGQRWPPISTW